MALQWGSTAQRGNPYARKTNLAMTAELTLANGNDSYANNARMNAPSYSTKAIGQRGNTYFERPVTNEEISQAKGSLALLKSKKMKPSTTTNAERDEAPYALNSMLKYQPEDFQFQNPAPRRAGNGEFNTMDLSRRRPGPYDEPQQEVPYTQDLYHQNNGNYRRQFKPATQAHMQQQYEQEEPRTAYGNNVEVSTRKDRLLNRVNNNVQNEPNYYGNNAVKQQNQQSRPAEIELPEESKMNGKSRLNRLNTRKAEDRTQSQEPKNVGSFGGKNNGNNGSEYEEFMPSKQKQPLQKQQNQANDGGYTPSALNSKPPRARGGQQQQNQYQSSNPEDERPAFAQKGQKDSNPGIPNVDEDDGTRVECPEGCGRKFNEEALEKHVKICKKVFQTKRKEFDSAAMRQPEDENGYVQKPSKNKKQPPKSNAAAGNDKKSKWRAQSEAFRAGIRAGKGEELSAEQKQALAAAEDASMIKCPCCGRKFNETAGKRHIPVCQAKAKNEAMKQGPPRRR